MTNGHEILHIRVKLSEFYFNNDSPYLMFIFIMPPTLKKWGHIGFGLSVCMYVCVYVFMFEISS